MALTVVKTSALSGNINLTSQVTGTLPVANGGTALTSGFVNGGALTEVDTWRKTSAMNATSSRDFLTNNLERVDTNNFSKVGTGMTESSGVFTFPSTGVWLLRFQAYFYSNSQNDHNYGLAEIHTTTDDGTYDKAANSTGNNSATNQSMSSPAMFIFNCTDTSTHKVKFSVSASSDWYVGGSSADNDTWMDFIKLAEAQ